MRKREKKSTYQEKYSNLYNLRNNLAKMAISYGNCYFHKLNLQHNEYLNYNQTLWTHKDFQKSNKYYREKVLHQNTTCQQILLCILFLHDLTQMDHMRHRLNLETIDWYSLLSFVEDTLEVGLVGFDQWILHMDSNYSIQSVYHDLL